MVRERYSPSLGSGSGVSTTSKLAGVGSPSGRDFSNTRRLVAMAVSSWRWTLARARARAKAGAALRPVAAAGEHTAGVHDPLAVAQDVAVCARQPAADLVHVDMRLDPVADPGGAGKIDRYDGGGEQRMRAGARRGAVAERDIAQRHQRAAMGTAATIGMMRQDPQSDDEAAVLLPAHEEGAKMVQERAGAKQRHEPRGRIDVGHAAILGPALLDEK